MNQDMSYLDSKLTFLKLTFNSLAKENMTYLHQLNPRPKPLQSAFSNPLNDT